MSLAKYKANKLIASFKKGYGEYPENCNMEFLWKRFLEEIKELEEYLPDLLMLDNDIILIDDNQMSFAHMNKTYFDWYKIKCEIGDISNFIDFIFDKILELENGLERVKE